MTKLLLGGGSVHWSGWWNSYISLESSGRLIWQLVQWQSSGPPSNRTNDPSLRLESNISFLREGSMTSCIIKSPTRPCRVGKTGLWWWSLHLTFWFIKLQPKSFPTHLTTATGLTHTLLLKPFDHLLLQRPLPSPISFYYFIFCSLLPPLLFFPICSSGDDGTINKCWEWRNCLMECCLLNTADISRQRCQRRECKTFQLRGFFSYWICVILCTLCYFTHSV